MRTKKILSVLLSVVMLFGVIAVGASAMEPSQVMKIYLDVSGDNNGYVKAGDTITVTVSTAWNASNTANAGSAISEFQNSMMSYLYNPAQLELNASTSQWLGETASYATAKNGASFPSTNNNYKKIINACTAEEKKVITDNSLNAFTKFQGVKQSGLTWWAMPETKEGYCSVDFKVANTVTDGEKIVLYMPTGTIGAGQSYIAYNNGTKAVKDLTAAAYDLTDCKITLTVGAPAAASILKYSKSQIRFKGITATSGPSTYEGTFDVRTVAKISQADFLATFTSEENAKAKITDFGFVYAAKSNVASFNVDTAKSVAEGATVENYVKAPVTYMQHTADGADYIFTCLITNINDADKTDGVNCLAYVCFDGNYIYFDAAESVDYSTLYALMPTA